eukprot:TRINITY_DN2979_c0_g1_i1.p1 TRINITY_DN2979_c0_g1~~TRINITY_DN2979_c0_g1_i1.p1  ORF type:complete len:214 (+),score=41.95 TRINITY_DN2979_c0_g1_i1:100-741(+)
MALAAACNRTAATALRGSLADCSSKSSPSNSLGNLNKVNVSTVSFDVRENARRLSVFQRASLVSGCGHVRSVGVQRGGHVVSPRAVAMEDSLAGMDEGPVSEPREYPPGMVRYETMVVLRPDMTEDERVDLTERYEEAMVAGGALDVEMFNRGMQPLAYNIKTKNMGGFANRYLDGIYLLFTYVTKPESQVTLQKKLNTDDDIIRSTTFRLGI